MRKSALCRITGLADHADGFHDYIPFALECQHRNSVFGRYPSCFIYLMVMVIDATVFVTHQKKVHEFMIASALAVTCRIEPVLNGFDRSDELRDYSGFLADLAERRLLGSLAVIDQALRQLPTPLGYHAHDRDLNPSI